MVLNLSNENVLGYLKGSAYTKGYNLNLANVRHGKETPYCLPSFLLRDFFQAANTILKIFVCTNTVLIITHGIFNTFTTSCSLVVEANLVYTYHPAVRDKRQPLPHMVFSELTISCLTYNVRNS